MLSSENREKWCYRTFCVMPLAFSGCENVQLRRCQMLANLVCTIVYYVMCTILCTINLWPKSNPIERIDIDIIMIALICFTDSDYETQQRFSG